MKLLNPIPERPADYDELERMIRSLFKKEIYMPLVDELGVKPSLLKNSLDDLISAIQSGRIYYVRGTFQGGYSSTISRELKKLGAKWDRTHGRWKIPQADLPPDLRRAIGLSEARFRQTASRIDRKLSEVNPIEISEKIKLEDFFNRTLWKTEKKFQKTVSGVTVAPKLTLDQSRRIAKEYTSNMQLYIQEWIKDEIIELRQTMQKRAFEGFRYETAVKDIKKSYGVSQNKAKFLARQETSLLMTKFKQTRYQEAGVNEYIWRCVVGSPNHPVRPLHEAQNGKKFTWDHPPIVTEDGKAKNPGQDYNCRCVAQPVVRF